MTRKIIVFNLFLCTFFCLANAEKIETPDSPAVVAAKHRCTKIAEEVSKIRGLDFKQPVTVKVQSLEDFGRSIDKSIEEQYGDKDAVDAYVKALVMIGVLDEYIDLRTLLKDLYRSQAAAHYDPDEDTYFLISTNLSDSTLDMISSHELCHALQHHNFDLNNFILKDKETLRNNSDMTLAKQSVAEGDATLVMSIWSVMNIMGTDDPAVVMPLVSASITLQSMMSIDMLDMLASGTATTGGDMDMLKAIKDLKSFPRFFTETLMAVYLNGAAMVEHVRGEQGWDGVNKLFTDPPQSMEQVLHPEKLLGKRESPSEITFPDFNDILPADWKLMEEDVLGELGLRILVSMRSTNSNPAAVASGWDGDRYLYFENTSSSNALLVWKLSWDTEEDMKEFDAAYRTMTNTRYKKTNPAPATEQSASWELIEGRTIKIHSKDRISLIVNAPDSNLCEKLFSALMPNTPEPKQTADQLE